MPKNSIVNALGCGLAIILISGCSSTPKKIEISAEPVEKPVLVLPQADELRTRDVDWVLITEENFSEQVEKIKKTGRPVVFFALTDRGYENLALNLSDIRSYIQQQKSIIAAYENYYLDSEIALDSANASLKRVQEEVRKQ